MTKSNSNKVTVVVTGLAWMGNGVRSINSLIEEKLPQAQNEIQVVAYRITKGSGEFLDWIVDCLNRGLRVTLVINRLEKQSLLIKNKLLKLVKTYSYFSLLDFSPENYLEDLHAKIIVIDRSKALIGSSNITWKGLVLNHELGVFIDGPAAAKISSAIDLLGRDQRTKVITR